jgi:OOP family OmpA-OmpF porin
MSNLLHTLKGLATTELISAASKSLGESEEGVTKAFDGILPSILNGLLHSNSSSHSMIGDLLSHAGNNTNTTEDLIGSLTPGNSNAQSIGMANHFLDSLFGDKVTGISNLISNFSGIKSSSSNALLGIGGSLIASFLGNKMASEGLNFGGILNWIGGHKNEIESALPTGFSNLMHDDVAASIVSNNNDYAAGGMRWLMPLLLLGLLAVGIFVWLKGCNNELNQEKTALNEAGNSISSAADSAANAISNTTDSATTSLATPTASGKLDASGNWISTKGAAIKIKLANGTELDATKGSLEDRLYQFITDPAAQPGKDIWFNFEDLLFDSGKSTLKDTAVTQLQNTVAILKAYPAVIVKLGGYTDNTGDSLANVKLSESRAKAVYNQMISKGLRASSFDAKAYEGYGPLFPVAENTTLEGRGQNRRISISVRAK